MRRLTFCGFVPLAAMLASTSTVADDSTTYRRFEEAPLWALTYTQLDQLLQTRFAVVGNESDLGSSVEYWAKKQLGTAVDITMADLTGTSSQYLVQRSVALACARSLQEYYAILSLTAFQGGKISWTHANIDIEGELIPHNDWLWEDVTQSLAPSVDAVGRYFKALYPWEKVRWAAAEKGEISDLYTKNKASALRLPGWVCSKVNCLNTLPLANGDLVFVVYEMPISPKLSAQLDQAQGRVDRSIYRHGRIEHCAVVTKEDNNASEVFVVTTQNHSSARRGVRKIPLSGLILPRTLGIRVLRLRPEALVVARERAAAWLEDSPLPDFDALDHQFESLRGTCEEALATGSMPLRREYKPMVDRSLADLWFGLPQESLRLFALRFGVTMAVGEDR